MPTTEVVGILAGTLVALAVLATAAYTVGNLSKKNAVLLVGVLTALTALITALPAVIRSFQSHGNPSDPPLITRTTEPSSETLPAPYRSMNEATPAGSRR
jgi:uncharacterized membrane protein YdfJ with MMPL/SSD domain